MALPFPACLTVTHAHAHMLTHIFQHIHLQIQIFLPQRIRVNLRESISSYSYAGDNSAMDGKIYTLKGIFLIVAVSIPDK